MSIQRSTLSFALTVHSRRQICNLPTLTLISQMPYLRTTSLDTPLTTLPFSTQSTGVAKTDSWLRSITWTNVSQFRVLTLNSSSTTVPLDFACSPLARQAPRMCQPSATTLEMMTRALKTQSSTHSSPGPPLPTTEDMLVLQEMDTPSWGHTMKMVSSGTARPTTWTFAMADSSVTAHTDT